MSPKEKDLRLEVYQFWVENIEKYKDHRRLITDVVLLPQTSLAPVTPRDSCTHKDTSIRGPSVPKDVVVKRNSFGGFSNLFSFLL